MADLPLLEKVSIVTGASSGMGRQTALALAKRGSKVVCCDLRPEANPSGYEPDLDKTTVELIQAMGRDSKFIRVDISNSEQVDAAFKTIIAVSTFTSKSSRPLPPSTQLEGKYDTNTADCIFPDLWSHRCSRQLRRILGTVQNFRRGG